MARVNPAQPQDGEKQDGTPTSGNRGGFATTAKSNRVRDECPSPTPSGEDLTGSEIEKFIEETNNILQFCQTKIYSQKIENHTLAFVLLRIKESLNAYSEDYISKLTTFLVHADKITAEYYAQTCCELPKYGDNVRAIEVESEQINVGSGIPLAKKELLSLVRSVTNNYHTGATMIKTSRDLYKDINSCLSDRKNIVDKINTPMPIWMEIQDVISCQLENIREQISQISTFLNFLKQGEAETLKTVDFKSLADCGKDSKPDKRIKQPVKPAVPKVATDRVREPTDLKLPVDNKPKASDQTLDKKQIAETSAPPEPDTIKNEAAEPPEKKTSVVQIEEPLKINKDSVPNEIDTESDDDLFNPERRIRTHKK